MKALKSAVLYMGLALVANPLWAGGVDIGELEGLRDGTMKKLIFAAEAQPVSAAPFVDFDGNEHRLSDWQGKYVLVNFWATWCAPCRKEMPQLDALQGEFGGDAFEVVTIAVRSPRPGMEKFFEDAGVQNLPLYEDASMTLSREMGVLGLPITVLLDPEGREIGRVRGDAEWYSDSARAIVAALVASEQS
ncbi:MAG: TlpA family protein disulfide reductase [Ruegeria sp.]